MVGKKNIQDKKNKLGRSILGININIYFQIDLNNKLNEFKNKFESIYKKHL